MSVQLQLIHRGNFFVDNFFTDWLFTDEILFMSFEYFRCKKVLEKKFTESESN